MTRPRSRRAALLIGVIALMVGVVGGVAYGAFSATTSTTAGFSSAPDWIAPSASASVIAPTAGSPIGQLQAGQTYYVYAIVGDTGNPASGTSTVTTNVSSITPGQTAAPLSAGSFVLGGITYNYRSASLPSSASLATGTYAYSLALTDVASNSGVQTGFSVQVTPVPVGPAGVDVQTANGGATVGQPETGDSITFTYSTAMDPSSILANWTGSSTSVTVDFSNGGGCGSSLSVRGAALGSVCLGGNYVNGNRSASATMVMSGSSVIVTLTSSPPQANTVTSPTTMTWTPSSAAKDMLGNPCSTTPATESGGADVEF